MRFSVKPLIIFLDEDPVKSSWVLSTRFIDYNIRNCVQVLVCANLYMVGIRNRKACSYYFGKERKTESLQRFFPNWPMKKPPSFVKYTSQESRWCRKCKNHYDVILGYLGALLEEFAFRRGVEHELQDMYDFLQTIQFENSLRLGIKVVFVKGLKVVLPWKNLPLKYRKKDIIEGYRKYYKSLIIDPFYEYRDSKRDIPEWLLDNGGLEDRPFVIELT